MITENINSIVDRLLTDTRILSIMPFLVILVASLSLGIPFADAKNNQPESESEDLSVSPDTATESPISCRDIPPSVIYRFHTLTSMSSGIGFATAN